MSEMIERVARAMQKRVVNHMEWDEVHPDAQGAYLMWAEAAIKSMREPTEFMLNDNVTHPTASAPVRKIFWQEMIDRALTGETKG